MQASDGAATSDQEQAFPAATSAPSSAVGETGPRAAVHASGLRLVHGERVALQVQRLNLPEGSTTAVIGPNGSGKSTLLDAIGGILRPDAGSIDVFGRRVSGPQQNVSYVLQHTDTDNVTPLTAREVVRMGRYPGRGLLRRLTARDHDAVRAALERLGVTSLARRQLSELSGGERQRVLVAQALVQAAPLMLLDEPMTALDLPTQRRIAEVLAQERVAGHTVVYTTHSIAAARTADWVVLLAGTVVASGPPASVLRTSLLGQAYGEELVTDGGATVLDDTHHHGPATGGPV